MQRYVRFLGTLFILPSLAGCEWTSMGTSACAVRANAPLEGNTVVANNGYVSPEALGDMRSFIEDRDPELAGTLRDLERQEKELQDQIEELASTLRSFGRMPEADDDITLWRIRLDEVGKARRRLNRELEDAYLSHLKYYRGPTIPDDGDFRMQMEHASTAIKALHDHYRALERTNAP